MENGGWREGGGREDGEWRERGGGEEGEANSLQ